MSNTKTVQSFRDSLVKGQITSLLLRKIIFFCPILSFKCHNQVQKVYSSH